MMKRFFISLIAILCCACALITFVSCDNDKDTDDGNGGNNVDTTSIFYVKYGDTKIELGKKAAPILKALGDAKSVKELGDCAGLGAQVKYTYDNFDLYTLKNDEGETIDEISFTSDIAVTPKGICLGATADEVTDAYGKPTSQSEKAIIYTKGKNSLKFGLKNGEVSSIDYVRAAN